MERGATEIANASAENARAQAASGIDTRDEYEWLRGMAMRERLTPLGGMLTIESNRPGTAVISRIPD